MLPMLARHFQSAHLDPNGVSQQAEPFSAIEEQQAIRAGV